MNLLILGSGTAALQAERGPSGHFLKIGDKNILLDGGTGTLLKLQKAGISYQDIDQIFYTHLHPDHTIDLVPFLFATKYTPGFTRTNKLELFGPVGFKDFFHHYVNLFGTGMIEVDYEIEINEMAETSLTFDDYNVVSALMHHSANAVGYKFENKGKKIVYSGDTEYCDNIINLAADSDVLLIESSFPDENRVPGHLTYSESAQIAKQAGVKKLILTHLYPPFEEENVLSTAKDIFCGEVLLAKDFMKINID